MADASSQTSVVSTVVSDEVPATGAPRPSRPSIISVGDDLTHSGVTLGRFFSMHVLGAIFPVSAGLILYGWRAGAIVFLVITVSWIGMLLWCRIGIRGRRL